jgi:hypothetical protein
MLPAPADINLHCPKESYPTILIQRSSEN